MLEYLQSYGNGNILHSHLDALEKDVLDLKEHEHKDIVLTPHFSAWLRLYTEYLSNSLYHSYYWMTLDGNTYEKSFGDIISEIRKVHRQEPKYLEDRGLELTDVLDSVYDIIDLRHCFQHGGLPNIIRELKYTTPDIIDTLLNPRNFLMTRQKFETALAFANTIPKIVLKK